MNVHTYLVPPCIPHLCIGVDGLQRVVAGAAQASLGADTTSLMARAADIAFAATFAKARRQRMMDRRVVCNAAAAQSIEEHLAALHVRTTAAAATAAAAGGAGGGGGAGGVLAPLSREALDFYFCTLSQCDVVDLMASDAAEVLGFGLAVQRPEAVVDCPTLLCVQGISTTLCSRGTMEDAVRFGECIVGWGGGG